MTGTSSTLLPWSASTEVSSMLSLSATSTRPLARLRVVALLETPPSTPCCHVPSADCTPSRRRSSSTACVHVEFSSVRYCGSSLARSSWNKFLMMPICCLTSEVTSCSISTLSWGEMRLPRLAESAPSSMSSSCSTSQSAMALSSAMVVDLPMRLKSSLSSKAAAFITRPPVMPLSSPPIGTSSGSAQSGFTIESTTERRPALLLLGAVNSSVRSSLRCSMVPASTEGRVLLDDEAAPEEKNMLISMLSGSPP
mmetsp:Transcript_2119/g.7743  ORF Transcript_2119/g.7743 Transcript_2119/m.7743 type:complete len:253 (-) Transcript_2119:1322-2080(-)